MAARPRAAVALTEADIEAAALAYLARFAASSAHLRRLLWAKALRARGTDQAEARRWIAALIERLERSGVLDDRGYSAAQALSLHRRGASHRTIRAKLAQKGVGDDAVGAALAGLAEDGRSELAAAMALARRRRLGPYRPAEARAAAFAKDLAVLARGGFSETIARRVLAATDPEAIKDEVP